MVFAWASRLAHAHGEEVLTSLYGELASIGLCITLLFTWRRAKAYRAIGMVACMCGVVAENWMVSGLPYMQYRNLITALGFIGPIASTVLAVYVSQDIAIRRRKRPST